MIPAYSSIGSTPRSRTATARSRSTTPGQDSGRQGSCTELDIGTLGLGAGKNPVFRDPATGVTIEVVKESTGSAVVRVTKA
ncbi:hypothetical protein ABGB18_31450 [Nonomuraea sp. B12E4]|uniref:hypothetical protein n=1 Tax=Nonomuraea sp. B12E4 TaxID=3153564 RepID=UPI00325F67EA